MTLADPSYLLALLAIPAVGCVWLLQRHRRRRYAVRFPATAVYAGIRGREPKLRRYVPVALLTAAAAALAVALARPQVTIAVPVEKASVVLVTDESGSMSATDVDPTRLGAAQTAARAFLDKAPDSLLVGFVGFASSVENTVEPTADRAAVSTAVDGLAADGGTATGDALTVALDRLAARKGKDGKQAPAAIVLLSDGATTEGSDPLVAARRAASLGIPVSTVALGTDSGTVPGPGGEPVSVPPDAATLQEISRISGGSAYATANASELAQVYKHLGSKIGTRREKHEVTSGVAGAGLVLLLAGLGTGVRRRTRLV